VTFYLEFFNHLSLRRSNFKATGTLMTSQLLTGTYLVFDVTFQMFVPRSSSHEIYDVKTKNPKVLIKTNEILHDLDASF
jgi:hypothetical protein